MNYVTHEINVKIVYYGPGLSGKTTNLLKIHEKTPEQLKSKMTSLATETDRTIFFDFLPLDLGKIRGFTVKMHLYSVPGQVYYNATRKLVLRGVDGIVFVADSAQDKIEENIESFRNLEENLMTYGYRKGNIPIVLQYNKIDLPNALSTDEINRYLNKDNLPWNATVANKSIGIFDTLKFIGKQVVDTLEKKYSRNKSSAKPQAGGIPVSKSPVTVSPPVENSRQFG
jgi:small GTP-binding protein